MSGRSRVDLGWQTSVARMTSLWGASSRASRFGEDGLVMADDLVAKGKIEDCLGLAARWEERTATVERPEVGSSLEADDQLNPRFPTSAIAWASIGNAVDHLGMIGDALQREGSAPFRPTALYTLTRGALVAASQAIWVLTGDRTTRIRRTRLLELEEAKTFSGFLRDYATDVTLPADVEDSFMRSLSTEADRVAARAADLKREIRPASGDYSVTRTLRDAAASIEAEAPNNWMRRALLFEWRASSGDAHARLWTKQVRPGEIVEGADGSKTRLTTGSYSSYSQSIGAATVTAWHALRLWDVQRIPEGRVGISSEQGATQT